VIIGVVDVLQVIEFVVNGGRLSFVTLPVLIFVAASDSALHVDETTLQVHVEQHGIVLLISLGETTVALLALRDQVTNLTDTLVHIKTQQRTLLIGLDGFTHLRFDVYVLEDGIPKIGCDNLVQNALQYGTNGLQVVHHVLIRLRVHFAKHFQVCIIGCQRLATVLVLKAIGQFALALLLDNITRGAKRSANAMHQFIGFDLLVHATHFGRVTQRIKERTSGQEAVPDTFAAKTIFEAAPVGLIR
jgi:hypothetical protein